MIRRRGRAGTFTRTPADVHDTRGRRWCPSRMSEILVMGGGVAGLCSAMLLARDGHHVTVLERDACPPPEPADAWSGWERRGVNQFRLAHAFLPRFRATLD